MAYPLFAPTTTFARINFLRQGGRLVNKKGTHNVKILTENKTTQTMPCTRAKGNGDGKHVCLQTPAQAVAAHAAHSQRRQHQANAEVIGHRQMGFDLYSVHQMVSPMPPFWGVTTFATDKQGRIFRFSVSLFGISHTNEMFILVLQHKDNQHPAIYTKMMVGHNCFWKIVVRHLLTMRLRLSTSNFVWQ